MRSWSDRATGQDAGTGRQVWEYRPPGNSRICATEADAARSVMVVTRDDENRPAADKRQLCTTLAAVDMKNGREIWRPPVPAVSREKNISDHERALVTAGDGLTVLAHQGLRAIDVSTGTPRWTAAVPPNCVPAHALPAARPRVTRRLRHSLRRAAFRRAAWRVRWSRSARLGARWAASAYRRAAVVRSPSRSCR